MELLGNGRPLTLTDELVKKLVESVPKVYTISLVAAMCKVLPDTLRKWLIRGKNDLCEDKDSIFANLFLEYHQKRAEVAYELNRNLKWHFKPNSWVLERAFRKEFGNVDEYRKFYDQMARKLGRVGIDLGDFDSFMEDMELAHE